MAITQVDKMKIIKFFRENKLGEIYYGDLVDYLGKKARISDTEFVTFFANYVSENLKKEQVSLNIIGKMVSSLTSFIGWLHDDKVELDIELIDQLHTLQDCYEQYVVDNGGKRNETLDELFPIFVKDLNEYFPKIEEIEEEIDVESLKRELDSLKKELSEKEKEVESITIGSEKKDRIIDSKRRDVKKLNDRLNNSEAKRKELEDKIKELENLIIELRGIISSLEEQLKNSKEECSLLSDLKTKLQSDYYNLKLSMKELRRSLESREKEISQFYAEERLKIVIPSSSEVDEDRKNRIEGLIIQKMILGRSTIDELLQFLIENGHTISKDEIREHLKNIREKLNLEPNVQEEITSISLDDETNNYTIWVPSSSRVVDLMLVSDFHLNSFDKDIIQDMELINDYCEENGISTILNAGDLFSLSRSRSKKSESICKKIVERVITKYPVRSGITHAVMGGNHDKEFYEYGVDPIKMLTDERTDFVNLGYGHCKIAFGGTVSILDTIGMHHPNRRFPEPVGAVYSTDRIQDSLNHYYIANKLSRDDVYVDVLGHIHKSGLDSLNGICIIPSYRKDRVLNGAWHLKVYFGEDGHISNIVFIPIIKQKKLMPTTEICYKKQLIK